MSMHPKLRMAPVIYLVGFMGCGKSTVGRLLAERLGWTFADLDEEIERRSGVSIAEIFERQGEARFREMESQALAEQLRLAQLGGARVIALGGGAFVEPRNRERISSDGVSIWLECPVEILWQRVEAESQRPLARDRGEFERLYRDRIPHYQGADFTVAAGADPAGTLVDRILALPLLR